MQFLSPKDLTPEVKQLIDELKRHMDIADRILATVVSEKWREVFIRCYGVKPSSTQRFCMHWLLGKPCKCTTVARWMDHQDFWIKNGKPYAITSQPYHLEPEDVVALGELVTEHGLKVDFVDLSFYFPSRSTLIMVTK